MKKIKKLPDAEFDIMKVVWANEPPITTNMVMQKNGKHRQSYPLCYGWWSEALSELKKSAKNVPTSPLLVRRNT